MHSAAVFSVAPLAVQLGAGVWRLGGVGRSVQPSMRSPQRIFSFEEARNMARSMGLGSREEWDECVPETELDPTPAHPTSPHPSSPHPTSPLLTPPHLTSPHPNPTGPSSVYRYTCPGAYRLPRDPQSQAKGSLPLLFPAPFHTRPVVTG